MSAVVLSWTVPKIPQTLLLLLQSHIMSSFLKTEFGLTELVIKIIE